jgi:ParB family chromosome partitioning protein
MSERYASLPLSQIEPDPLQPRHELESVDDPALTEARTLQGLAQSIREFGILQPIRVRRLSDAESERYCIVSGQRRYEAAKLAGLTSVPTLIEDDADSADERLLKQVTENFQRKALTATELALAIASLLQGGESREGVERKLGIQSSQITILLSLLNLSEPVKVAFARGRIESPRAAYDLNRLPPVVQEQLITQAEAKGRVIGQREVREARAEYAVRAVSKKHRFEAPEMLQADYAELLRILDDGVGDAYAPEADRDVVFGEGWRRIADPWAESPPGEPRIGIPEATGQPLEEGIDVPSFQLSREQALRLLDWLVAQGAASAEDLKESASRSTADTVTLGKRLAELLARV